MTNLPMRLKEPQWKIKSAFPIVFFILPYPASPVSGPLHRLATVQQAFSSAWYMHNATAADWPTWWDSIESSHRLLVVAKGVFQSMNSSFFFHSFLLWWGWGVFFLIQPPTLLKKNLQKILSSNFSSKCCLKYSTIYVINVALNDSAAV